MRDTYIFWPIMVPIFAIVGVFTLSIVRAVTQARVRELEVRERIAMIERGLVPPPEKDPGGFDRAMSVADRYRDRDWRRHRSPGRYRSAGVTMIGVGFGLMLLIGISGNSPNEAIGVGGFLVVMGLAFFLNHWLERNHSDASGYPPPPPPGRPPGSGAEPPTFGSTDQPHS